jgi:hypothetical protein
MVVMAGGAIADENVVNGPPGRAKRRNRNAGAERRRLIADRGVMTADHAMIVDRGLTTADLLAMTADRGLTTADPAMIVDHAMIVDRELTIADRGLTTADHAMTVDPLAMIMDRGLTTADHAMIVEQPAMTADRGLTTADHAMIVERPAMTADRELTTADPAMTVDLLAMTAETSTARASARATRARSSQHMPLTAASPLALLKTFGASSRRANRIREARRAIQLLIRVRAGEPEPADKSDKLDKTNKPRRLKPSRLKLTPIATSNIHPRARMRAYLGYSI